MAKIKFTKFSPLKKDTVPLTEDLSVDGKGLTAEEMGMTDNLSNLSNSLSNNDIIKALEYCSKQTSISDCEKCEMPPLECRHALVKYALDLINRQKAEIERLKEFEHMYNDLCK